MSATKDVKKRSLRDRSSVPVKAKTRETQTVLVKPHIWQTEVVCQYRHTLERLLQASAIKDTILNECYSVVLNNTRIGRSVPLLTLGWETRLLLKLQLETLRLCVSTTTTLRDVSSLPFRPLFERQAVSLQPQVEEIFVLCHYDLSLRDSGCVITTTGWRDFCSVPLRPQFERLRLCHYNHRLEKQEHS